MARSLFPLSLLYLCMTMSSADILKNPDFEIPLENSTSNATTSQFLLLSDANSIPGWSFSGTVWYVSSGPNISLPGNGHGLQLGEHGKINQSFAASGYYSDYVLTFTMGATTEDCLNNLTAVKISVPHETSRVVYLQKYGRKMWESYALYLGSWGDKEDIIRLEIESVKTNGTSNFSCWPVVDTFLVKRNDMPKWYDGNLLANGGFEIGPAFLKNSSEGVLLDEDSENRISPLQEWSIIGTIKYIDSQHYKIPKGKAAVELVPGVPSGVQMTRILSIGSTYTLNFTMGDANNSCAGDFVVYIQVGNMIRNFTMQRNDKGSVQRHSMTFKVESTLAPISFTNFNETGTSDGVLCGPVLDDVVLWTSHGLRSKLCNLVLVFGLFFAVVTLI